MLVMNFIQFKSELWRILSSYVLFTIRSFSPGFLALLAANIFVLMGKVSMGVEVYFLIKVDDNAPFYPAQTGISGGIVVKCFIQNVLVLLGYLALLAANNLLLMREVSMDVEIDFSINLDANSNFYPA